MIFIYYFLFIHFMFFTLRREGDSNPRYPLGVYTLSRRASSTTRASLLNECFLLKSAANYIFLRALHVFSYKCILFFVLPQHSSPIIFKKNPKLINFKVFATLFEHSKHF